MATAPSRKGYAYTNPGQSNTALTVSPDGSIAIGDWMVMVLESTSTTTVVTPPSGWRILQTTTLTGTLRIAMYGKIRAVGDSSYTVTLDAGGTTSALALMWGSGGDAVANWTVGAIQPRNTINPATTHNNVAPSVTTTVDQSLVLAISSERTTATETGVTSVTGATEWFFGAQSGSQIETIDVSYINQATAGATGDVTIVYPNTQTTNGLAQQLIIPPSSVVSTVPTRDGNAHNNSTSASVVVTTGAIPTGSWMVAVVVVGAAAYTHITPAGWTILADSTVMGTRRVAVYGKMRDASESGLTTYTFSHVAGAIEMQATVAWGSGAQDVSHWILGAGQLRANITPTTTFNNIARSITTTTPNTLALIVSAEATIATESAITSITGATEWFFAAQGTGDVPAAIETVEVGYINQATAGATGDVTIVYPNTQANNGWAMQIGIPSASQPIVPIGLPVGLWNGTSTASAYMTLWNGTREVAPSSWELNSSPVNVTSFFSKTPLMIAHRGGSANWPEMTMRAYKESADVWGMGAIEVSVQVSSDGTFWCSHDATTTRTTGANYTIASTTDAVLAGLSNTATATDNPSQPAEPMVKLQDVLAAYAGKRVIFIEDKTYTHTTQLLDLLDANGGPNFFIWKQDALSTPFSAVSLRGYSTWGYFFDPSMATSFATKQGQWTYVGLDYNSSDTTLTNAISLAGANRVIAHIIPSTTQRDRLLNMGVLGLMVANVRDCLPKIV